MSTKEPAHESKDELRRLIDEAAKYVPMELASRSGPSSPMPWGAG